MVTDPKPGSNTGVRIAPTNEPVEAVNDARSRHEGSWNSFQFAPPLTHEDALLISAEAERLGYTMGFRRADYSEEEVQAQLEDRGPSSFLDVTWLEEDISPKAAPPTAAARLATRLHKLAPKTDLIITDPYLFTSSRKKDAAAYAASVGTILGPALSSGLRITAIVDPRNTDTNVQAAVEAELRTHAENLHLEVVTSEDFHDRFWIADRSRGLIIGASLNKIGRKIFFVDELSTGDVVSVLEEVDEILRAR